MALGVVQAASAEKQQVAEVCWKRGGGMGEANKLTLP